VVVLTIEGLPADPRAAASSARAGVAPLPFTEGDRSEIVFELEESRTVGDAETLRALGDEAPASPMRWEVSLPPADVHALVEAAGPLLRCAEEGSVRTPLTKTVVRFQRSDGGTWDLRRAEDGDWAFYKVGLADTRWRLEDHGFEETLLAFVDRLHGPGRDLWTRVDTSCITPAPPAPVVAVTLTESLSWNRGHMATQIQWSVSGEEVAFQAHQRRGGRGTPSERGWEGTIEPDLLAALRAAALGGVHCGPAEPAPFGSHNSRRAEVTVSRSNGTTLVLGTRSAAPFGVPWSVTTVGGGTGTQDDGSIGIALQALEEATTAGAPGWTNAPRRE